MRMNTKLAAKSLVAISATVLVSACGGGSGSSGGSNGTVAPANLKSAPGAAAITSYVQTSHQSTLTASDTTGNSYVMELSTTPKAGTTSFDGHSGALSSADSMTLSKNGVHVGT